MKKVCIIDYEINNISSVSKALKKIDINFDIIKESNKIKNYSHIILPGIGSFEAGMKQLKKNKFDIELKKSFKKGSQILGICLGMHLLFKNSEESLKKIDGLNIVEGNVFLMKVDKKNKVHIPQVGWNSIYPSLKNKHIFNFKDLGSDFYFIHSYVVRPKKKEIIKYFFKHGTNYPAIIQKENILATQFHPEKSKNGLVILQKFINKS
jgi:imidazole glycerol-phosphate synthase subunit HisH